VNTPILEFDFSKPLPPMEGDLAQILYGRGWMTSEEIVAYKGVTRRWLREQAELDPTHIISGNKGYCHWDDATRSEILQCSWRLIAQAIKMFRRAMAIRRKLGLKK
jgi:hypothetical protein